MSSSGYDDYDGSMVADASLHPPIHGVGEGPDDAGVPIPTPASVLLDFTAYIDGRRNATTAWSKTRGGHRICVTFWPAHPPRVSYFSVFCPDLKPRDFAAEDDVVLLRVLLGTRSAMADFGRFEYFVYQAGGGCMPPSLKLLRHPGPSRILHHYNVGLLRCRGRKGDGFYVIASLLYASFVPGRYDLYTYDSRAEEWATKMALLRQEQELGHPTTPPIHTTR
ncbi:hypothetical protein C2845_PM10G21550 [Panicum miliaceum]|uniref:Uncharacterized protein n=1 Tax=Panicum miliaceum TaxID=4540 RepID=A0A3L6PF23_PANMI|nr:hypothetical protein C2845_PM10G21550 [Panicum miliaceum]